MTATATVREANGAGQTLTTITNCRFKCADNATQDTADPTKILAAANYSYWKSITIEFTATFSSISNIRYYSDGTITWTLGTAGEVRRGNRDSGPHGCPTGSYEQAAGPGTGEGYDIDDASNGHGYYDAQTTATADVTGDVSASPPVIDNSTYTSSGDNSYYLVLQIKVDTDATQGYQATETLTWLYDEV